MFNLENLWSARTSVVWVVLLDLFHYYTISLGASHFRQPVPGILFSKKTVGLSAFRLQRWREGLTHHLLPPNHPTLKKIDPRQAG